LPDGVQKGDIVSSPHHADALAFLSCLQLADSFFPSGLYTLSHGLETCVQLGQVDGSTLAALLAEHLQAGFGASDSVALACAHRAGEQARMSEAIRADRRLTSVKLARETRETSCRVGRQLLNLSRRLFGQPLLDEYAQQVENGDTPGNHAIVLGLSMALLGIAREQAVLSDLYAFSASFVAAGVRLNVIEYRAAQAILHQHRPLLAQVAQEACTQHVEDIASSVPWIDVMAMCHEQAEIRLFMS
jgi:urease accessory protein